MLTLLGSLLGFLGSAFPEILRCFEDKRDHAHELALFRLQLKMAALSQHYHATEVRAQMEAQESAALYRHARPTGIAWVEALSGSVRPILTYTFFLLFIGVKVAQGSVAITLADEMNWARLLLVLWQEEDQALFAAVMSFWFGQRALRRPGVR